MTGLRFCMPTTFYPPYAFGGDAIAVQRLAQALVRAGHRVTVVHDVDAHATLRDGPAPAAPEEDDDHGVRVVRLRSRWGPLGPLLVHQLGRPVVHARRLRQLLAPGRWDVVHFHNVSLVGGPGLLTYPRDAVTLYTAHEHWLVCPTHVLWRHRREPCPSRQCLRCTLVHRRPPQAWRYTGLLRRAIARVDVVLAQSEFSRTKHREFGLEREMEVLPPFLPAEPPGSDSAPGAASHPRPYFLFAGRLERLKGVDDLVRAFRDYRAADLLVAGTGGEGENLQREAADLPHIHLLGWVAPERLRTLYRGAIAALVPSRGYETFGMVLIEAFREGTPVIARRLGPLPETVELAAAGELFSTMPELVAALGRLQSDTAYRHRLGRAGAAALERWWTDRTVIPAYLDIVRRAAARRGLSLCGPESRPVPDRS